MKEQCHHFAVSESTDFRSFAVEAFVGHRASGWPFARFDISVGELRVRLAFPWSITRSQDAAAIRAVVITRRFGDRWWIRFDDSAGSLGDVHVHPLYRRQQMVDELRRCGYLVIEDTAREGPWWHRRCG
jgi:hypothetical protein